MTQWVLRIKIITLVFLFFAVVLILRLAFWQIVKGENLSLLGKSQYRTASQMLAKRGAILASDGHPLAQSKTSFLVWAQLSDLDKKPEDIAVKLAPILASEPEGISEEEERITKLLIRTDVVWVPIKHKVELEKKEEIEKLAISGIGFDRQEVRLYPEASMTAHLLGFVGSDQAGSDTGYFGLEGKYDVALSGREGRSSWERDAAGNPILSGIKTTVSAIDGIDIITHINRSVQFIIEKKLAEGLEKYNAAAGTIIVMRPSDGAILAMSSLPSYDPAKFSDFGESDFINPAISTSFEPGSIFKILVMSAALDSGSIKPDMKCDTCRGPREIAEYTIRTWDGKYHPDSTPAEIIQNSDNIGMVWVGEKLGGENMHKYLSGFGIGQASGIDLQGEATPKLREAKDWGFIDLATASFGQGIAVTPIQLVRATAAIANRGKMPTPQVADRISGPGWEEDIQPVIKEPIISQDTAELMTQMMVRAVHAGEAKWAAPRDFAIAGKTGTAQIPIAGHYDPEKTIASFIGFAPAEKPAFVMLVTLREPQSSPWASETAAPLWFSLAREIFPILGIQPR